MPTMFDALQLAFGIGLVIAGGEALVRGAAALARQFGVPPLVVGLTVMAFGTSAPELAVNVSAALRGDSALAFGNLVGSNLANVGFILAGAALVTPLAAQSVIITRELPMMLLASAATLVMGFDALRGEPIARYDRSEGLILLLLFGVFLYYTIAEVLRKRASDPLVQQLREQRVGSRLRSYGTSVVLVFAGLAGLAAGGQFTVTGASQIATALGAPQGLIGLTIVALGTSLPEFSATLMAVRKGEIDLAVGNVVGSNVFNLLFVLGVTASIRPVEVPKGGHADLIAMVVSGTIVLVLLSMRKHRLARVEGALLMVGYVGYVLWRVV